MQADAIAIFVQARPAGVQADVRYALRHEQRRLSRRRELQARRRLCFEDGGRVIP